MEFLNEDFQKKLWKAEWGNLIPYDSSKHIDFYTWYSSVSFLGSELEYKSKKAKYGDFYINSHLRFRFPDNIKDKYIRITYDNELTRLENDGVSEISMLFEGGKSYDIDNVDEQGQPLKSRKVDITKREIQDNSPSDLLFLNRYSKKPDYVTLSSRMRSLNDRNSYPAEANHTNNGWNALDFIKVNDYTIKVFFTDNIEAPNFHDLVVDIEFPATLQECEVGFWDNPEFYKTL